MKVKVADSPVEVEVLEALPTLPGMPEGYHRRGKADALQVPAGYMGIVDDRICTAAVSARFSRVIRTDDGGKLWTRFPVGGFHFVSGDTSQGSHYPKSDPFRPGQPRFDWYEDITDQHVRYGFLRE